MSRVPADLAMHGLERFTLGELGGSAATAANAAAAIDTTIARIVGWPVFLADRQPIVVLVCGPNRGREAGWAAAVAPKPLACVRRSDVARLSGGAVHAVAQRGPA